MSPPEGEGVNKHGRDRDGGDGDGVARRCWREADEPPTRPRSREKEQEKPDPAKRTDGTSLQQ